MSLNRPHPAIVFSALIIAAVAIAWAFSGCGGRIEPAPSAAPSASKITTTELARTVTAKATEITPKLATVAKTVDTLTPENVASVKPVLRQQVQFVMQDFSDLVTKHGKLELSIASDVKEKNQLIAQITLRDARIQELETADPVKFWFQLIGGILVGGCSILIVLSFTPWGSWAAPFRTLIGLGLASGFVLLTLAYFLRITIIVIGITAGVGFLAGAALLIAYAWRNRKSLLIATTLVKSLEEKKVGTVVDFSEVKQPPMVKAFVDSIQAQMVNSSSPVNGFQNLTTSPAP